MRMRAQGGNRPFVECNSFILSLPKGERGTQADLDFHESEAKDQQDKPENNQKSPNLTHKNSGKRSVLRTIKRSTSSEVLT
jgi:hypothetical protein